MVVVDIEDKYKYRLEFHNRINFIRGDSGTGKSDLCFVIAESERDKDILVNLRGIDYIHVSYSVSNVMNVIHDAVVFIDNIIYSKFIAFWDELIELAVRRNLYLVILSRVDMGSGDIYTLRFDNGLYTLERIE